MRDDFLAPARKPQKVRAVAAEKAVTTKLEINKNANIQNVLSCRILLRTTEVVQTQTATAYCGILINYIHCTTMLEIYLFLTQTTTADRRILPTLDHQV